MGRLPDVYVIGAPKCGTSALHAALDRHPQLFMSAVKEPKYFLGDDQPPQSSDGPNDAIHLARYVWRREDYVFELFPKEQVLVLRFEDLVADAEVTLARIHRFLGVDDYSDGGGIPVLNLSAVLPHDWLTRIESWATRKRWLADRIPAGVRRRLVVGERRRTVNQGPPASARRDLMPFFADDIRLTHELTGLDVLEWLPT